MAIYGSLERPKTVLKRGSGVELWVKVVRIFLLANSEVGSGESQERPRDKTPVWKCGAQPAISEKLLFIRSIDPPNFMYYRLKVIALI